MAVRLSSCLVNSCRINHFGINPVRGGRPPRDRRINGVKEVSAGDLVHEVAKELMFVDLFALKIKKVEEVIRI